MGPVRTPSMSTFEQLIEALHSERNSYAAGKVMDRAREVLQEQRGEIKLLQADNEILTQANAALWAEVDKERAEKFQQHVEKKP